MEILYWYWLVFGMILILSEIFLASFTVLWFGLGAILVGLLSWVGIRPEIEYQLLMWATFSVGFTIAWFKWVKPMSGDRTMAGTSREAFLGERCLVIKAPADDARGTVRFSVPILGSDTWTCIAKEPVKVGDTVIVDDVHGNTIIVKPAVPQNETINRNVGE
ncbi:MAG: hypothetical protein C0623_05405 [Desulfuromonas sp.]|nr:MAG: hypothetical protein C0623_05405 [Desulfuromonas sp.]